MNTAVFLDRDGTIVRDVPYCSKESEMELLPGVAQGIRMLNQQGLKTVVVTNQSGIGRGYFDENVLGRLHDKIINDLGMEDAQLDDIYYCPHTPADSCDCRKPKPGMLEKAAADHCIDLAASFMIGNKHLDMQVANQVGSKAICVPDSDPELQLLYGNNTDHCRVDFVALNFLLAAKWVLANAVPMNDVSFIIPTRNEEYNMHHVLPYLPYSAEVIIVDGHSQDNTIEVARKIRPDARIIMQKSHGKGEALKQGFKAANGEYVITFDADGSFSPIEVYSLVSTLREGYDMVKGSRFLPGGGTADMPMSRQFGNACLTTVANLLYRSSFTDLVYGLHAFRRTALEKLNLRSDGFSLDAELYLKAARARLKVKEVPSFEGRRIFGSGKLNSLRDGTRILKTILQERIRA